MNDVNKKLLNMYIENKINEKKFTEKCYKEWSPSEGSSYVWQHFYCTNEYLNSKIKIMFIGQESYGWGYEEGVKESMEFTKYFLYNSYNTIFWEFMYELESKINGDKEFNKYSFFYSNIFRICVDSNNNNEIKHLIYNIKLTNEYIKNIQTLYKEIKIVKPDIIIFLSGPNYDKYITNIFKYVYFKQVNDMYSTRELSRIINENLPINTFRLYHPMYANRYRDKYWDKVINIISNSIKSI